MVLGHLLRFKREVLLQWIGRCTSIGRAHWVVLLFEGRVWSSWRGRQLSMSVGFLPLRHFVFHREIFLPKRINWLLGFCGWVGEEEGSRWLVVTIQYLDWHPIIPPSEMPLSASPSSVTSQRKAWVSGWITWVMGSESWMDDSLYGVSNNSFWPIHSWFLSLFLGFLYGTYPSQLHKTVSVFFNLLSPLPPICLLSSVCKCAGICGLF